MNLVKIVVTVPSDEADQLRRAVGDAGGGKIGNYSHCSFSSAGTGRFLPGSDANPAIGSPGELEAVKEERLEITCSREIAKKVVRAIRNVHSYEEPAIDIYPLLSEAEL